MGNYNQLEIDFVTRTIQLIDQYEELKELFPFEQQFNHTLMTNCLLGLIILPKAKALTFIPKTRLTSVTLAKYGIKKSSFHENIKNTQELFKRLRNSVAHFDIEFISESDKRLIDKIAFNDAENGVTIATFYAEEFLPFLKFYSSILLSNLIRRKTNEFDLPA